MTTVAHYLIQLLEHYDVDYTFGIPGVHNAELYRHLSSSRIQHVTPRHEQGAGFAADGYARVSGKPGVCLLITGPGLSNAATAMLQAKADSIPMLVISTVNQPGCESRGHLHEMPDQAAFAGAISSHSTVVTSALALRDAIDRAFETFASQRPGPVHTDHPTSFTTQECNAPPFTIIKPQQEIEIEAELLQGACAALNSSLAPLIIAGGGSMRASVELLELAEKLGSPIVATINARGWFPSEHPLLVPASPSLKSVREFLERSDCVLAVGTELGPTDFDMDNLGLMPTIEQLIRIDIDADQASRNMDAQIKIVAPAELVLEQLLPGIDCKEAKGTTGQQRAEAARKESYAELPVNYQSHIRLLERIKQEVANAIFVGDSTQLVYAGNMFFASSKDGGWFNSATGFGTLGYGLPAALGAKIAAPEKPVIALIGDGGMQFSLSELGTLMDMPGPIIVLIWNNNGYGEIKNFMQGRKIEPLGVDVAAPDFVAIAKAYAMKAVSLTSEDQLVETIAAAAKNSEHLLIDMKVSDTAQI